MKKDVWKNYDFEKLPRLTDGQLKSFKKIPKDLHLKFKKAVKKQMGRPKKHPLEKENIVSVRFSPIFLKKLKDKAGQEGYTAWQTYMKKILSDAIGLHA
ncbi:MAG: hypothetical protein JNJ47_07920 [Alphaproteobacteria bacterium]|nr:hypothetical protein [Alphaproteobacteria bacterium]